jgi:hypothetical protein
MSICVKGLALNVRPLSSGPDNGLKFLQRDMTVIIITPLLQILILRHTFYVWKSDRASVADSSKYSSFPLNVLSAVGIMKHCHLRNSNVIRFFVL